MAEQFGSGPAAEAPRAEAPQYVAARLKKMLTEDPRTAEQGVRVTVRGTDVYLRGDVASTDRRAAVAEVAGGALPGACIHNEIRVVNGAEPAGEEEIR